MRCCDVWEGTFCPLLYARVLLYIAVYSARGAENIGVWVCPNNLLHLYGASRSPRNAGMWEKKLFLSLVVWVSLSMLFLASLENFLSLQEHKEHAMGSCILRDGA